MISVIMPTYNEAKNIKKMIERTAKVLQEGFEIIVVDDDSPDGTAKAVVKLIPKFPSLRLTVRNEEKGFRALSKKGFPSPRGI